MQQNSHFLPLNIKQQYPSYDRSFIHFFTLCFSNAVPSTVSFQALRADAEMKARVLKRLVKNRDGTGSKIKVLQISRVGIQNPHKASYRVKNWKDDKLMSFPKTLKGQKHDREIGGWKPYYDSGYL